METVKIHKPVYWRHKPIAAPKGTGIWGNLAALNNKLSLNRAGLLLALQCALFLPLPVLTIVYFHAHFSIVAVIFIAFAANIIACMDKPGMRSLTSIFAFCVIDALMLIVFLI